MRGGGWPGLASAPRLGRALAVALRAMWAFQMLSLLLTGRASVMTSLFFFASLALASHVSLGSLGRWLAVDRNTLATAQLAAASAIATLTAGDLYLRYGSAH